MRNQYDGIILGTGHDALVLIPYLARSGLRVRAVERSQVIGGGLATEGNPRFPASFHNTHSFFHRALTAMPWYRDLELERHGAKYIEPDLNVAFGARLMNVFERSSDVVEMTAVSDLINGWSGGVIQASWHSLFVTPTYLAIKLYGEHLGRERLATRVDSRSFDSGLEGKGAPYLGVVASRSSDGKKIFIKAVNSDLVKPLKVTVKLAGVKVAPGAQNRDADGGIAYSRKQFLDT